MLCKYCHLKDHFIDSCPTIICKICKEIGHPQWLCTTKNQQIKPKKNFALEKKYQFSEDIKKKKNFDNNSNKNIEYYIKLSNKQWSDFI
jgi:hypothetical protein